MTLETVTAGTAGEDERGQHGQCCEDPLHLSLPSLGCHVCRRASTFASSGGLVGDLRAYLGPIRLRHRQERVVIWRPGSGAGDASPKRSTGLESERAFGGGLGERIWYAGTQAAVRMSARYKNLTYQR
jgi:hypothetical protein